MLEEPAFEASSELEIESLTMEASKEDAQEPEETETSEPAS